MDELNKDWVMKYRTAIADPFYIGPPIEEVKRRAGITGDPSIRELNKIIFG